MTILNMSNKKNKITSDYANPHVSACDKNKFGLHNPSNPDDFFDTKKSAYKSGRYIRLIKL